MKIKVALTGGIGSGKSTVLSVLKELGYSVYSCDEIYKNLIHKKDYVEEIDRRFACVKDGQIQLDKLSQIVFSNPEKRRELNAVAHPRIMQELLLAMENASSDVVFAEVPLLFEERYENLFDKVLVVFRDVSARVSSVKERDLLSDEQILARINAQVDYDSNCLKEHMQKIGAHYLYNDGDILALKEQLKNFLKTIQP